MKYQGQISREAFNRALEQCETEPFLTPGSIQAHGLLIAFEAQSLRICQVSANTRMWFHHFPGELLETSLAEWLPASALAQVKQAMVHPQGYFSLDLEPPCNAHLHPVDGLMVLELEPCYLEPSALPALQRQTQQLLQALQGSPDLLHMSQTLCKGLRQLLSVDQVVVYQLNADGHGTVIAESQADTVPSYLDQHFPASDIPQQVRRHAVRHPLRYTPDVQAFPEALIPPLNPLLGTPLNQAACQLRSPHYWVTQYYANMGVRGVLALALVQNNNLWGYICAHHRHALYLDRQLIDLAQLLGQSFNALIRPREFDAHQKRRNQLQQLLDTLLYSIAGAEPWYQGILDNHDAALQLMNATGLVLRVHGTTHRLGHTPNQAQISVLLNWLNRRGEQLFCTDTLANHFQPASDYLDCGAGLLALSVSEPLDDWLLWFRPEEARTVTWAGKPEKLLKPGADGQIVLTPRDSFDRWVELVSGCSYPFANIEIELAQTFRNALLDRLFQISQTMRRSTERYLQQTRRQLNNLLGSLQDIVWQAESPSVVLRYISPPVADITGYPPEAFLENPQLWLNIIHPEDRQWVLNSLQHCAPQQRFTIEYRVIGRDGKQLWLRNRGRALQDMPTLPPRLEGIATDITQQKLMANQLQQQTNYDLLTGLPNRYLTLDRLSQLCHRQQRDPRQVFTILYLNIHRFRLINDSLGHRVGDQVLIKIAQRLDQSSRGVDTVGRLGSDEFVVLLPGVGQVEQAIPFAHRLEQVIGEPLHAAGQHLQLSVSIGIRVVNQSSDAQDPDRLLQQADSAEHAARHEQQLYRVFDPIPSPKF